MFKSNTWNDASRHEIEESPVCFFKALIFLALGFAILWCALHNWGTSQGLTLVSGIMGLAIGARYLVKYFSPAMVPARIGADRL